ncbi:hypothetical protein DWF00_00530 [Bosea caraganae]|uniref:Uncharacterized protein n=1 Tax=Bosea caraganae TaxID=2763117 RepID=A0A370L8J9_9HYPH|nr:hypothetical protein DWE98_07545 [Bosea caraganae]RDJ30586.1 hypothetical protein DWF00_00530 [Bosea caraganae]
MAPRLPAWHLSPTIYQVGSFSIPAVKQAARVVLVAQVGRAAPALPERHPLQAFLIVGEVRGAAAMAERGGAVATEAQAAMGGRQEVLKSPLVESNLALSLR